MNSNLNTAQEIDFWTVAASGAITLLEKVAAFSSCNSKQTVGHFLDFLTRMSMSSFDNMQNWMQTQ